MALWARCAGVLGFLALSACGNHDASRKNDPPQVTVAAAANLTEVLQGIGPRFEAATGLHPVFSFASTAQLAQQIENSAPFDVFLAADSTHVDALERKGLLIPGSRAVYARGVLALWIPAGSATKVERIEDLAKPEVRFIAIAKPELAPYGQASVETLKHASVWDQVRTKVVYAENISVAKQYGSSHNADVVFTAYSLVLHEAGQVLRVDETLHQPINQELGITRNSKHPGAARKLVDFLVHGQGRDALIRSGYAVPGGG